MLLRTFQVHDSSDGITPGTTHLGHVITRSIASNCKPAGGKDQHRFRKVWKYTDGFTVISRG